MASKCQRSVTIFLLRILTNHCSPLWKQVPQTSFCPAHSHRTSLRAMFSPLASLPLCPTSSFLSYKRGSSHTGSTCCEWKGRTVVVSSSLFHYICCALATLQTDSCIDLLENKNRWGRNRAEDAFVPPEKSTPKSSNKCMMEFCVLVIMFCKTTFIIQIIYAYVTKVT